MIVPHKLQYTTGKIVIILFHVIPFFQRDFFDLPIPTLTAIGKWYHRVIHMNFCIGFTL